MVRSIDGQNVVIITSIETREDHVETMMEDKNKQKH